MVKLSKSDYTRLVLKREGEILGSDKNREGQNMARALFIREHRREPNKAELKDFLSRETKGHSFSISRVYESTFGENNPVRTANETLAHFRSYNCSIEALQDRLSDLTEEPPLTLYARASSEENGEEIFQVYKISLN